MAENIQKINSLPIRSVRVGSNVYKGRFDEKENIIYLLDSDGKPTGKRVKMSLRDEPNPEPNPEYERHNNGNGGRNNGSGRKPKGNQGKSNQKNQPQKRREQEWEREEKELPPPTNLPSQLSLPPESAPKSGKKKILVIGIAAVIAIIAIFGISSLRKTSSQPTEPDSVQVIIVLENIPAGTTITETNVTSSRINLDVYNQFLMTGKKLYTWDKLPEIVGAYTLTDLAQGQYLTADCIGGDTVNINSPFFQSGEKFVIPAANIDLTDITVGSRVKLTVKKQVGSKTVVDENSDNDGFTSETETTQVQTYTLTAVIGDFLTNSGESIYKTYARYNMIAQSSRADVISADFEKDASLKLNVIPAEIVVMIDKEKLSEIEKGTSSKEDYIGFKVEKVDYVPYGDTRDTTYENNLTTKKIFDEYTK